MIPSIILGAIPPAASSSVAPMGGSTNKPRWLIQTSNPVVLPLGSKPWLDPRIVTPNAGGTKLGPLTSGACCGSGSGTFAGSRASSWPWSETT